MPIYQFRCAKCGVSFERIRSVSVAGQDAVCSCGYEAKAVLTVPGRIKMGTGTYRHDAGMNLTEV